MASVGNFSEGVSPRHSRDRIFCFSSSVALATLLGCLASGSSALAEDNAPVAKDDEQIEEIVVTGSHIKRRDFVTPSPLTTIIREDIEFTGQATLEETLHQMPQMLPYFGRTSNNPPGDEALVNLRGLGPGSSLTLLNGRRLAGAGAGNSVNLNNIPQVLVERVEIISGGTSAVYGSDAVAGVINFVTRQDFEGLGIEAGMTMAAAGDANTYDLNLTYGHNFANGRGNLTVYANLFERRALYAGDREFTSVPYEDDSQGNLVESGSPVTPEGIIYWPYADLGSGPVEVTFNPDGTPREFVYEEDKYNYAPENYLQVPLNRDIFGLQGHYELSDRFEGYIEASFARNEIEFNLAPVPALILVQVNLDNPVLVPETRQVFTDFYGCGPNLACVFLAKRLTELGPRISTYEQDYSRLLAGVKGEIGGGWEIDGWVTYTKAEGNQLIRNLASTPRIQQGLLVDPLTTECFDPSGDCRPLDLFGPGRLSPDAADFVRVPGLVNRTDRTSKLASVFVTGTPIETGAGPLGIAIGLEWRSDDVRFSVDDGLTSADVFGWNPLTPVEGREDVFEYYAEVIVPLAHDRPWADHLGLELGARYSDHEYAGGVWTYKAGAEWKLNDSLGIRTIFQRSARAPNNNELFAEQGTTVDTLGQPDPCSASEDPVGNGNVEKCVMQGLPADQIGAFEATDYYPVDYIGGGNPELTPEVAETWTAGVVITPASLPDWTMSVDYFSLDVEDTIGGVAPFYSCFDPLNTGNLFCDKISRDASGNVAEVEALIDNRGFRKTTGVDMQIQYQGDLPEILALRGHSADIGANLYWTHVSSYKEQETPFALGNECAGHFGWICGNAALPADRVTGNAHYLSGPLGLHLTWRWIEGSRNAYFLVAENFGWPEPEMAVPKIEDEQYFDVGLSYAFGDSVTARFGVYNLLDNDPPMMANAVQSNNTDTGLYDVFGRSYYLALSVQF